MPSPTHTSLERRLGPFDAAAIIVANVIGGGILFTPPLIASMVPHPIWFLSTWIAGGVLAFFGAMAYAELAALRPRAGGEYVYLREAYGPLAGFMTGWTSFVAGFAGALAASAIFLIVVLDRFIPGAANSTPFFVIPIPYVPLTFSRHTLLAITAVWLFAIVHIVGVGPGRAVMNVLATLKVLALLVFIARDLRSASGSSANLQQAAASISPTNWLLALMPVMFTYSGWNAASYMAEEIRDPGRNVPRALLMGTIGVIIIYALLNLLYLYAIPVGELAGGQGQRVRSSSASACSARARATFSAVVAIISLAAGINAWTFAGPRIYYAMARDGVFFPAAAQRASEVQDTAHVDHRASIVDEHSDPDGQPRRAGQLCRVRHHRCSPASRSRRCSSCARASRKRRALTRRSAIPSHPAIFVLTSLAIVLNALVPDPRQFGLGLLVIASGIPLYLWLTRRRR